MIPAKAALFAGLAAVTVAGAVTGAVVLRGGPSVVVPATAFADESTTTLTNWFEPSAALVPKGPCGDTDRVVVRTDALHYRDVTGDPKPHEVVPPRRAGTSRLGTDAQLARLKDGRLLYVEMGVTQKPFSPKPDWADYADWQRSTFELFTSDCGDVWTHALSIDTKDVDGGVCAVAQINNGAPWPGGFDRFEVHVDPWRGDVYVTTACRGGTAPDFRDDLFRRMLLFRMTPDVSEWAVTRGIQLNYGVPVAVTTTEDGSVHLLRCDYANRPQLLRLADRGERLVAVADVQHDKESTAAARCTRGAKEVSAQAAGMTVKVPELRLAPAGPRAVRVAYQQIVGQRPRVRLYTASYGPLPTNQPCLGVRTAYLAQFEIPDEGNVAPVPECGARPSFSEPRIVTGQGSPPASVVHFDLIAPDVTAVGSAQAMASSLLYWMEHSPETGTREVRYRTIAANGSWSAAHTVSAAPWTPRLPGSRDADYEYGGYAFVDGRCRYALVWNQTHAQPAAPNLYAHYAVVDDLSCTGTVASPAPVTPSPSPTTAKPTTTAKQTTAPPTTAPPPTTGSATSAPPSAAPTTTAPTTTAPKPFGVTGVTLDVQTCTRSPGDTWECAYTASFTFSGGSGGTYQWRIAGTLRHDCYPSDGGGVKAFAAPARVGVANAGQKSVKASGYLTFDQAPNPADVYGSAGQLSVAHVEVVGTPTRSADDAFASEAVCGKP